MQSQSEQQSLSEFLPQMDPLLAEAQSCLADAWQPLMATVSTHIPDRHAEQASQSSLDYRLERSVKISISITISLFWSPICRCSEFIKIGWSKLPNRQSFLKQSNPDKDCLTVQIRACCDTRAIYLCLLIRDNSTVVKIICQCMKPEWGVGGCSIAAERTPHYRLVVGLNSTWSWDYYTFHIISIREMPNCIFYSKLIFSCQPGAKKFSLFRKVIIWTKFHCKAISCQLYVRQMSKLLIAFSNLGILNKI